MHRNQTRLLTLLLWILSASCLGRSALGAVPQETVLYSFAGAPADGSLPNVGVAADKAGNLYGTTQYGGTTGNGTIFKLSPPSTKGGQWTESVLYNFQGGADGFSPYATPVLDPSGNLYGTTMMGGANNLGIIYQLSPPPVSGGAWTETILHPFGGGADGAYPSGNLILDVKGNLYGTTQHGGNESGNCGLGCGTVFEMTPPISKGGAWNESILYSFIGYASLATQGDGAFPQAALIMDRGGNLYGTTVRGGANPACWGGCGTVFRLHPASGSWTESVLHRFTGGADGSQPLSSLVLSNGILFGTTYLGGTAGGGTVFELTPASGAWTLTPIYEFGVVASAGYIAGPGVAFDLHGNLYGITLGNLQHNSTLFELTPPATSGGTWSEATLYTFSGTAGGAGPNGVLLVRGNTIVGTTIVGGSSQNGTVYELTH